MLRAVLGAEVKRSSSHCSTLQLQNIQASRILAKYLQNAYPLQSIMAALKKGFDKREKNTMMMENKPEISVNWIKIPYLPGLYENCKKICETRQIKLVPSISCPIGGFFKNSLKM